MDIVEIGTWRLAAAYLLALIPLGLMLWFRIRLLPDAVIALVRMTVQLIFVGLYLQFIFDLNNPWLNLLWLGIMIGVADLSIAKGCGLRVGRIWTYLFGAVAVGTAVPLLVFVGLILERPNLLDAQYAIPIGGMIMGNCMRVNIVGIRSFYDAIRGRERAFEHKLCQGALLHEAVRPYMADACRAGLAPMVATMATIGLVSLPGMMTGVIMAGASPITAIKYQIAIMIAIFSGTAITVPIAIKLTMRKGFTRYGVLDKRIFRS